MVFFTLDQMASCIIGIPCTIFFAIQKKLNASYFIRIAIKFPLNQKGVISNEFNFLTKIKNVVWVFPIFYLKNNKTGGNNKYA